jgi:GNAT superfamily N-acetyltransferase
LIRIDRHFGDLQSRVFPASASRHRYVKQPEPAAGRPGQDVPVHLTLIERIDGFSDHTGFNEQWWRPRIFQRDSTLLSVHDESGTELARVEMIERTQPGEYLVDVDPRQFVKVQFIEVRQRHRGRGVGSATLQLLAKVYPDRRLLAFSEADGFWDKTGWTRHIHREDNPVRPRHQSLYLQPD